MSNGWTGGQYSLLRALLGAYMLVQFARFVPAALEFLSTTKPPGPGVGRSLFFLVAPQWIPASQIPAAFAGLVALGMVASVLLLAGLWTRVAALVVLVLQWGFLHSPIFGRDIDRWPTGWLLLAHVFIPSDAYGSWTARNRDNPGGGWRLPDGVFAGMWVVLAATYVHSGVSRLVNMPGIDLPDLMRVATPQLLVAPATRFFGAFPANWPLVLTFSVAVFELLFGLLAVVRPLRPWLWTTMLLVQIGMLFMPLPTGYPAGVLLLHLFAFDPAWLPPRRYLQYDWLLYDGGCGLCHRSVRFVLAEDLFQRFRFAPLDSQTARDLTSEVQPGTLPDSVVIVTEDGAILTRFAAVRYILRQLGGLWRLLWMTTALIPAPLGNIGYDFIARVRHKLFKKPDDVCPIVPMHLRDRFEL